MLADPRLLAPLSFVELLPTRVRRNYTGGALLAKWTGGEDEADGNRPEDWIASTTATVNPGLPPVESEGITRVHHAGVAMPLTALIESDPGHYLGARHLQTRGREVGFLAKLLDSAIRLHVQAHPTAQFAQLHLNSRYGKLETYVILAIREGASPYLRLGFQRAPSREEWMRIITEQDIEAMDACFDKIPIEVGEVWRVPGGLPHAIGESVLLLEVMEPSDLVVRCEFVREGLVVPPSGRFMDRGLDFCLDIFDYQSRSVEEIRQMCQLQPRILTAGNSLVEELVGAHHTDCFSIQRECYEQPARRKGKGCIELLLVVAGAGLLECEEQALSLKPASRFILAAAHESIRITPARGERLTIISCQPNLPA